MNGHSALFECCHSKPRKLVGAFVLRVSCVAFDPMPFDLVAAHGLVEPLPEFGILYGLFVGCFPAVALPAEDPAVMPFRTYWLSV